MRRSRKPVWAQVHRGFESPPLRQALPGNHLKNNTQSVYIKPIAGSRKQNKDQKTAKNRSRKQNKDQKTAKNNKTTPGGPCLPGGYLRGMLRKVEAGMFNLMPTIYGLESKFSGQR